MTTDERTLLLTMASILAEMVFRQPSVTMRAMNTSTSMRGADVEQILQKQIEAVRARPGVSRPLTPRAKYVRVERAPADTRFNCQSCNDDGDWLVRIGEYYDPSFLCCPTCIREAAALLETLTGD